MKKIIHPTFLNKNNMILFLSKDKNYLKLTTTYKNFILL